MPRLGSLVLPACLFFAPAAAPLRGQEPPVAPANRETRLARLFEDWDRQDRPGGVALVVQEGKVVFLKAFGLACMEWNVPNTVRTVFDTEALGRPFTAWAAVRLQQEGKLSFEDPVQKHLPWLPDFGQPLQVRHLLEQTSGLPEWSALWSFTGLSLDDPIGMETVQELLKRRRVLAFAPGSRVQEVDTNYVLLAEVVRSAAGEPFREWTWRNLFRPLRMHRTLFRDKARELVDDRACGYNFNQQDSYLRGADGLSLVGSHSFLSTAEDLGKWLVQLQAPSGPPLVPARFLEPPQGANTWMGWSVETRNGSQRLLARGNWGGFRAALAVLPAEKLALAVLSNWDYSFHNPRAFVDELQDLFLPPRPAPAKASAAPAAPLDPALLKGFEGRFRVRPGLFYDLRVESGALVLAIGARSFPVLARGLDRIHFPAAGADLLVQRDAAGRARSLTWDPPNGGSLPRVEPWSPKPEDLSAFVGTYRNAELDVTWSLVLKDNGLVLRFPRLGDYPLPPEARDHFHCAAPAMPLLAFTRDARGRVTALHVETEKLRELRLERLP